MNETKYYYIQEHDIREDGVVNTSETVRSTFASALAYYYSRCSVASVTNDYVRVALRLCRDDLSEVQSIIIVPNKEEY